MRKSRKYQNYQHLVSGLSPIFLMLTGTFSGMAVSGTLAWYIPVITGTITWTLTRISSELTYRTSIALFEEHSHKIP